MKWFNLFNQESNSDSFWKRQFYFLLKHINFLKYFRKIFSNLHLKKWFQIQLSNILNIVPNNYKNTTEIPPIGTLTFSRC